MGINLVLLSLISTILFHSTEAEGAVSPYQEGQVSEIEEENRHIDERVSIQIPLKLRFWDHVRRT